MSEKLVEIAHKVSKIPGAKKILKPFYYPYKSLMIKKRNKRFRANALEALKAFDECMITNGVNYTLIFGSLLGAIREKGFIKHDLDIDVAVPIGGKNENMYNGLKNYGFKLKRRFSIDDGKLGCEETFGYKNSGVTIDIFYICLPIDELPYCCCWEQYGDCVTPNESMRKYGGVIPRRIELPFTYQYERVPFEDIEVNIDSNAHQISEYSYGPNYMIPDPHYVVPKEHRVIWYEKNAIYEEF